MASPRRILIDASAATGARKPEGLFWDNVLREMVRCLDGQRIYVLNRHSGQFALETTAISQLEAPAFDFRNSVVEDRRLAALCCELEIDLFLSTFYTSAGARVRSIFVALDELSSTLRRDSDLRHAAIRAARLASTRVAISESAARELSDLTGIPLKHIGIVPNPTGRELASAVIEASQAEALQELEILRAAEESSLQAESLRLGRISQRNADKMWDEAMRGGPLITRTFRAIRSVKRYPEFLRRVRRALGSRFAGSLPLH